MNESPQLVHGLDSFSRQATQIWNNYLQTGPGQLQVEVWEALQKLATELDERLRSSSLPDVDALLQAVAIITDLTQRCACRSEGLSFVSGEYGLIPRRDQHDQLSAALGHLQERLDQLSTES